MLKLKRTFLGTKTDDRKNKRYSREVSATFELPDGEALDNPAESNIGIRLQKMLKDSGVTKIRAKASYWGGETRGQFSALFEGEKPSQIPTDQAAWDRLEDAAKAAGCANLDEAVDRVWHEIGDPVLRIRQREKKAEEVVRAANRLARFVAKLARSEAETAIDYEERLKALRAERTVVAGQRLAAQIENMGETEEQCAERNDMPVEAVRLGLSLAHRYIDEGGDAFFGVVPDKISLADVPAVLPEGEP